MIIPTWIILLTLSIVVLLIVRMARLSGRVDAMRKIIERLEGFTGDKQELGQSKRGGVEDKE